MQNLLHAQDVYDYVRNTGHPQLVLWAPTSSVTPGSVPDRWSLVVAEKCLCHVESNMRDGIVVLRVSMPGRSRGQSFCVMFSEILEMIL